MRDIARRKKNRSWKRSFKTVNGMEACVTLNSNYVLSEGTFLPRFQNRKRYGGMRDMKIYLELLTYVRLMVSKP